MIEAMEERILLARPLGIDVSSFQGNVDWGSAYGGGVRFAYVKATQGTGYTNPYFSSQINGATDASVVAGAYDFADFNTVSASSEAAHFLSVAGSYVQEGYLRPALDMEGSTSMTKTQISNWVNSWASYVYSHTSVLAVVYASQSFASSYFNSSVPAEPSQYWEANYNGQNLYTGNPGSSTPYSTWTMWQVSSTGSVPGVTGNVDLDTYNGSIDQMIDDGGVVSSAGAKFNAGDTITVNSAQKAWNTYATNGTYVTEPVGKQGVVQSSTPVYIKGFERVAVKFSGDSTTRWVADNLESKVGGAASMAKSASTPATFSTSSVSDSVLGTSNNNVLD
jgi:GH25 family lysozyme M1 (1,4-beta-N-acetylmuramidase)